MIGPKPKKAMLVDHEEGNGGGKLLASSVSLYTIRVVGVAILLGAEVLAARYLEKEDYGLLCAGIAFTTIVSVAVLGGMDNALLRLVPEALGNSKKGIALGLIGSSLRRVRISSLMVSFSLLAACGGAYLSKMYASVVPMLAILMVGLPLQALAVHRQAVLRAFAKPVLAFLPEHLVKGAVYAILLLTTATLMGGLELEYVAVCFVSATALAYLLGEVLKKRAIRDVFAIDQVATGNRIATSVWASMWWISLVGIVNTQADTVLVGVLADTSGAAEFAVALKLSSLMAFGLNAVNGLAAPLISRLYWAGEVYELKKALRRTAKWLALYAVVFGVALVLGARTLLLMFGEEYEGGKLSLQVLTCGQCVSLLTGPIGFLLMMTGNQRILAIVVSTAILIKGILYLALVPKFGVEAAALTTSSLMVLSNLVLMFVAFSRTGIWSGIFGAVGKVDRERHE